MDLFERGRSLAELGKSMRWTDLRAFLLHAPPTSYYRRQADPAAARREEYQLELMNPTNRLLGEVFDQLQWLRQGAPDEHGVIFRLLARAYDVDPDELAREAAGGVRGEKTGESKHLAPQKQQRSSEEIRAQLKAASQKT